MIKVLGFFFAALLWFFLSSLIAGGIITNLPRPMQGEAPDILKSVCLGVTFAVQFIIPAVLIFLITKARSLRIGFLIATACAMAVNHWLFDGIGMLDKAWRRGAERAVIKSLYDDSWQATMLFVVV
jgi:hypothetical protein